MFAFPRLSRVWSVLPDRSVFKWQGEPAGSLFAVSALIRRLEDRPPRGSPAQ